METTEEYLRKLHFSDIAIKRIKANPDVQSYNENTLYKHTINNIQGFLNYGFNMLDIKIIIKKNPRCLTANFTIIQDVLEYLESLKYSKNKIMKMIKLCPKIFDRNKESIQRRLKDIETLGYNWEEVLKMFGDFSVIEELSLKKLKKTLMDLDNLGYSKEDIHFLTMRIAPIFGYSYEKISDTIGYLKSIGLDDVIINYPNILIQSVAKTYARYEFLKSESNIIITTENWNRLFLTQKKFKERYGVDDEYLLTKYPYNENKERKIK